MGLCPKPFVINPWLTPFTFPSVPITFSHVPPWFSKQNRGILTFLYVLNNPSTTSEKEVLESYVPIRSDSTVSRKRTKCGLVYTFLYVLGDPSRRIYKHPISILISPDTSGQALGTQEMPPGAQMAKTIAFHYVPHTFLYVPRQPLFWENRF